MHIFNHVYLIFSLKYNFIKIAREKKFLGLLFCIIINQSKFFVFNLEISKIFLKILKICRIKKLDFANLNCMLWFI